MLSYLKGIITGFAIGMYIAASSPQWLATIEETAVDQARALYHADALERLATILRH